MPDTYTCDGECGKQNLDPLAMTKYSHWVNYWQAGVKTSYTVKICPECETKFIGTLTHKPNPKEVKGK